jgi:hypothetical protein
MSNDTWLERCMAAESENKRLVGEVERLRGIVQADLEEKAEAWGEVERLRAALGDIARYEDSAREIVAQNRWPSTLAIDLAGKARLALSPGPGLGEVNGLP